MNPYTGHLVNEEKMQEMLRERWGNGDYEPVPPELERAANLKLAGKAEATVSLTSGGEKAEGKDG